jgi:acetyltransferase-like isoleucine patch superfamily enzyme/acyl carrier protein
MNAKADSMGNAQSWRAHTQITDVRQSSLCRYQRVIVGSSSISDTFKYELICWLSAILPGALGLWARPKLYRRIFKAVGRGTLFGANCVVRHPGKIELGDNVVISDGCILDARGDDNQGIRIGNNVIMGDHAMIRCKNADVRIGNNVGIGANSDISPVNHSNIELGNDVMLGPFVYLGGVQYGHSQLDVPIREQGIPSKGGIVVREGSNIGAFVTVMDGVVIGKGCVVGVGAVVRENLPDYTVATPHQRLVLVPRAAFNERTNGTVESSPQVKQESRPAHTASPRGADSAADSRVAAAIYRAIDWINGELPPDRQLIKAPQTRLVGSQSVLDSMQLVNLIVAIEREVEDTFGGAVTLADERALSMKASPFRSIQSLADYIGTLVNRRQR